MNIVLIESCFFFQIYLSRYTIHTSIPKDVHLVSMPFATYTCPILSYDACYSIAGVWVGSVAAISMLAARSRQRRWPAILNSIFFDESIPLIIEHEIGCTLSHTITVQ